MNYKLFSNNATHSSVCRKIFWKGSHGNFTQGRKIFLFPKCTTKDKSLGQVISPPPPLSASGHMLGRLTCCSNQCAHHMEWLLHSKADGAFIKHYQRVAYHKSTGHFQKLVHLYKVYINYDTARG